MLVLSRKAGESIRISSNIEVVVISVDGQRVRLGINAPSSVPVVRSEVDPLVVQANQTAAVDPKQSKDLLRKLAGAARSAGGTEPPKPSRPPRASTG